MTKTIALATAAAAVMTAGAAQANTILLDFDTPETGGAFADNLTISTELGDITYDDKGTGCSSPIFAGFELAGSNILCLRDSGGFDTIEFHFGVDSISGDTERRGGGNVFIEARDKLGWVLDSVIIEGATGAFSFDPTKPIYSLRIRDQRGSFSGIDNLLIKAVPAPGAIGLLGLGLIGLGAARRRKA